ncbi:hypothetical protein OGAPHI_003383 [Ogataea philodendri]|uniref:60S ribosomal protein L22-A n=1 Tax=Ogataea philodendri TaxID=1378263 RepID=A0A9P8T5F2_9ASCO|nr:uncharacterized protein OGAPHI_003383 [Ogataea philodendri]KAH3666933.1 hypothetical protein OGAPHI_003383 [Ogataea philodendri]
MYLDLFKRDTTSTTGDFYSNLEKVTQVQVSSASGSTFVASIAGHSSSAFSDSSIYTDSSSATSAANSVLGVSQTASGSSAASLAASASSTGAAKGLSSSKWSFIMAFAALCSFAKKFTVDCSGPTENGVFDPASYVKYLVEHIKVDGHLGNLGSDITVSQEGASKVVVVSTTKFSGKYLKYLSKRYLKKNQIRDWIRFVSVKKNEYQLQFYSVAVGDDEEEE